MLLDAATAGQPEKPARSTVDGYRKHLARIFVLDPIPAWIPVLHPLKRLTRTPKHHLVDPALAARLVGVGKAGLLQGEEDQNKLVHPTMCSAGTRPCAVWAGRLPGEAAPMRRLGRPPKSG